MTRHGPAVVALGGGHGLAATLRAARVYAGSVAAVVSVADDGGSSGRLRAAFDMPAPGDLRRCLGALADEDSLLARAFEHRFDSGELAGHPVGNLLIAGLTAASGDFVAALDEAGRLLGAKGRVLPATVEPVVLTATLAGGGQVKGQVEVDNAQGIERVGLDPLDPKPPGEVLDLIVSADQVVLGPGSLYSSVLAVLAVPAIADALASVSDKVVFVCNVRAVRSTAGFDVGDHVRALADHGVTPARVLCDSTPSWVMPVGAVPLSSAVVTAPMAHPDVPAHDPARLAEALAALVS